MKKFILFLTAPCALLLAAGAAIAQLPTEPYLFGVWEGTMTIVPPAPDGEPIVEPYDGQQQFPFRLNIRDTNLVMYFMTENGWQGIGESSDLQLNREGRSAIVLAAMSDGSGDAPTETWVINISRVDEPNITVYLSQVVAANSGTGAGPTRFGAIGQMTRVSSND